MGFLSDVLDGILDGNGASFGQRITNDNPALMELYGHIYFDFGLVRPRHIKAGSLVPVTVRTDYWSKNIYGFEIHGGVIPYPSNFTADAYGNTFRTISREIPLTRGRVWAYDVRRLDEGILIGSAVLPGEEAHRRSEEYLQILRITGHALTPVFSKVPKVTLEFGSIWERFGIPDRISVGMKSMSPLHERHLKEVINLILHNYNRSDAPPVTANFSMNTIEGEITLVMSETSTQPPKPTRTPEAKPEPVDNFPYDFYRGIGMIDNEDMVAMPSILGPVRVPMTDPLTKEYLLSYKPEDQ